jgi:tight adherence protein C
MPIHIYIAAFGLVASAFLLRWAFAGGAVRTSQTVKANLGTPRTRSTLDGVKPRRQLARFVNSVPLLRATSELQKRIAMAGLPWEATAVQFFRIVTLGAAGVLGGLLGVASRSLPLFLVFLLGGTFASLVPDVIIRSRSDRRQRDLERQLPDIFDRLKITLEAGLGFDSALANVVHGRSGPGYDEFKRVLQDLQLGVPRDEALMALSERTTVTDLRIILASVLQSGKYGLPLVEVLQVQTEELRDKRHQRAQEQAIKVPVKILFPLIFCILPTFFIVLVGPAIIRLARTL